ncbi:MAG: nuclear transport factor 2 family protein [Acidimicrobiales bacterium]
MTTEDVVTRYFQAMRQGAAGASELFRLFTPDAVYVEPFSDQGPAVGIEAIEERFRRGWDPGLVDMELDILEMRIDGSQATARWECRSPTLPAPVRGEDRYRLVDGKIAELEVRIVDDGPDSERDDH